MNKTLISTLLVVSALSFASAQTTSIVASTTTVLPPPPSVGDARIDQQIRALHKEMEARIKAIRDEYQAKLKIIIGTRKALVASSTAQMKAEREIKKEDRKEDKKEQRGNDDNTASATDRRGGRAQVEGTSTLQARVLNNRGATTTRATPNGNAWGFFTRFFGGLMGPNAK